MKRIFPILLLLASVTNAGAQRALKAIASQSTVVLGESFQVQYVLEGAGSAEKFIPPDLSQFRIIAGPDIYTGTMNIRGQAGLVKNWVYTLSCLQAGRFRIGGAGISENNHTIHANPLAIEIISVEEAARRYQKDLANDNSEYYLRPGEDPDEKIRKNLFLKVWVDHQNCYVGQPVVATFKLYSRVESKSDIVKNPGFYGFTVYDMVNLADKQVTTENISGKLFDVHTIRKVQLYPLQDGAYTIDEMDIRNKVEFSRSSTVNKRTEQEIMEGVLGTDEEDKKKENTEVFETEMHSDPLVIHVRPVPVKNKPAAYTGAVGDFGISARISKPNLARDEEGVLEVLISGKGNFIQLNAPQISWPEGIEGFEPTVKDSMDKNRTPLQGMRVYHFPFVCTKAGSYKIPPVHFTYFNPDSGSYQTVSTNDLAIEINHELKEKPLVSTAAAPVKKGQKLLWAMLAATLLVITAGYLVYQRRQEKKADLQKAAALELSNAFSVETIMGSSKPVAGQTNAAFYQGLQQSIWRFAGHYLGDIAAGHKKDLLVGRLRELKLDEDSIGLIYGILVRCEKGMFGMEEELENKEALWQEASEVLKKVQPGLL